MSSTEAGSRTGDSWGIDWRKPRIWLEFAGVSLQLFLIGAMASAFSVGVANWIWPDGHWTPTFFAMFAMLALFWILFRGWAFKMKITVQDGEFRNSHYDGFIESASKTDLTAYRIWFLSIPAVLLLYMGLIELFDIGARTWPFALGMVPAMLITSHGFPYVVERLRQSAAKRPASDS